MGNSLVVKLENSVNVLNCDFGVSRLFGIADIGFQGMLKGWAEPEESHTWNDGVLSTLLLVAPPTKKSTLLTIEAHPYVSERHPNQDISVYANGYFVGFWRMSSDVVNGRLECVILPKFWAEHDLGMSLMLAFVMPCSVRPLVLGAAVDHRELAFAFQSLLLS
jgi:hypothetical protein